MEIIVQKYGGTSVADSSRIKNAAKRAIKAKNEGKNVVVVVSAPAGMTDSLISKAKEISKKPEGRELDMILSTGEQISISLLSMAVQELGVKAVSLTGSQVGIITEENYNRARIRNIKTEKILEELSKGKIVIIAGFQGVTDRNEITTLGRGGSDITATALGCALGCSIVEIYTDVDGVYSADPSVVEKAVKIKEISYEEMLEMAGSGAKVLHGRCVELAAKNGLEIHLRSSFGQKKGTIVKDGEKIMEQALIRGISSSKKQAKITFCGLSDDPEILSCIFGRIAEKNINVDIIIQSFSGEKGGTLSFVVSEDDFESAITISNGLKTETKASSVAGKEGFSKISVIGIGMRSHPGIAAKVFEIMKEEKIKIDMVSCSEIKISCLIQEIESDRAVKALHRCLILDS